VCGVSRLNVMFRVDGSALDQQLFPKLAVYTGRPRCLMRENQSQSGASPTNKLYAVGQGLYIILLRHTTDLLGRQSWLNSRKSTAVQTARRPICSQHENQALQNLERTRCTMIAVPLVRLMMALHPLPEFLQWTQASAAKLA